jgi:heterodisulfide reductase subunit A
LTKAGLVIGAGIAGIEAALDLANQGFTVYVVEKNPSIGGRVAQLDKIFPKLGCAACMLTPKMVDAGRHPNIKLLAYSEVKEIHREGKIFKVKIVKKPRFVDENKCVGCGECAKLCPVEVANDFDEKIGIRSAIYVPFSQAVPLVYTIDREHCLQCELCKNVCRTGAINHQQVPEEMSIDVGAIIVTTGYDLFDAKKNEEYGFGRYDNVITGLTLERLLSVAGPTGGHVVRLSDGKIPRKVAFIQCVGPRDEKSGSFHCSKVCCMYATKQAELLKKHVLGVDITIYYTDAMAFDKKSEEFYQKAKSEFGIKYVKARVSKVQEKPSNNNLIVFANDVDLGRPFENEVDLIVLSTGLTPAATSEFAKVLPLKTGDDSFFATADPKIDPVSTSVNGVFLAGVAEGPKDIADSLAQAGVAAMKAAALMKE